MSFPRRRWFDRPFDRLTVLSEVEGLTTLSKVEGESRKFCVSWTPDFETFPELAELQVVLLCHSGLEPESSAVMRHYISGCRSKIPSLAGIKSGMTVRV